MPSGKLLQASRAQARLTESILAVGLILIIFTVSIYFMSASKIWTIYEKGDLDKVGYNLLSYLLEARVIDNIGESSDPKAQLQFIVQKYLPPMTFFKLTIFKGSPTESWLTICNANEEAFEASVEVSSISVPYTSKVGEIYLINLILARSEESIG